MSVLVTQYLGLILVAAGLVLLTGLTLAIRQGVLKPTLRPLEGYTSLPDMVGQAVESGGRMHVSLGPNSIVDEQTGVTLAGLAMLDLVAEASAISDQPPVATTGDATAFPAVSDAIRRAYRAQDAVQRYDPKSARLVALDPTSLAGGATSIIADENVQANVLIGSFGSEVALMMEAGHRRRILQTVGSDRLEAQAAAFVMADYPLIGEEIFAARAYLAGPPSAVAGLAVQDVLRWLVIGLIVLGAVLQTLGLLG